MKEQELCGNSVQVDSERFHFLGLGEVVEKEVTKVLLPLAEEWVGGKVRLRGTSVYGIR